MTPNISFSTIHTKSIPTSTPHLVTRSQKRKLNNSPPDIENLLACNDDSASKLLDFTDDMVGDIIQQQNSSDDTNVDKTIDNHTSIALAESDKLILSGREYQIAPTPKLYKPCYTKNIPKPIFVVTDPNDDKYPPTKITSARELSDFLQYLHTERDLCHNIVPLWKTFQNICVE